MLAAKNPRLAKAKDHPKARELRASESRRVQEALCSESPCGFYYRDITVELQGDRVIITGRLPNANLKEHLVCRLTALVDFSLLDDRVIVVNSQGLSTESKGPSPSRHPQGPHRK